MIELQHIEGHERYLISPCGKVYSTIRNRYLRPSLSGYGYLKVVIDGRAKKVHRLVAEAFIPNPEDLPQVNHIDEDKTNNHVDNLEWCTAQHNVEYSQSKHYIFTSPEGTTIHVHNLHEFCRNNELNQGNMHQVWTGDRQSHKGWRQYGS